MKRLNWPVRVIAFAIALAVCICTAANAVQRKSSDFKYAPFFEQKEDFDVLFMGTSHVINGIFPMELWNDYGIVSYNFGGHDNRIPVSYWALKNALDYTTPKLVVIDVLGAGSSEKFTRNTDYVHLSLDAFPISTTKIKGVYDLFDDPNVVNNSGIHPYDYKWEFIWDFGKYHSRWEELNENEITNKSVTREKGAESRIGVAVPNEYTLIPQNEALEDDNVTGLVYLRKMIEECQSRGIEVLLTHLPYPSGAEAQRAGNSVYAIAEEYGVNYINFVAMDNVVNYDVDCYDSGSHLNPSGARKVTDYLGKYIKSNYDIPDRRTDENYSRWFDDYRDYISYKTDNINAQKGADTELMLLADKGYSVCIYIKEDSPVLKDEKMRNLLNNLSLNDKPLNTEAAEESGSAYCLVIDNVTGEIWDSGNNSYIRAETSFGRVTYAAGNAKPALYIKDMQNNLLDGDWYNADSNAKEPDMQIFVIENTTGEIVSATKWDCPTAASVSKR